MRYKDHPALESWQVENEVNFLFGECPLPDYPIFRQEAALVKQMDPAHPVVTTDSGELATWLAVGPVVDALGVSVYRIVRNPVIGNVNFHYWFIPPYFYSRKALVLKFFGLKQVYISEFQMEPWSNRSLPETPIYDQLSSMNAEQMRRNFTYAEHMGISPIDFWGLEWWIWMKDKHGHPEFYDLAKQFFQHK